MLKRLLLASATALALTGGALAQQPGINSVPTPGIVNGNQRYPTYSAVILGYLPPNSATDIVCLTPGAGRNVYLKYVEVSGISQSGAWAPVALIRRNTAIDTASTAAATTVAVNTVWAPYAAPGAGPNYSTDTTAQSTVVAYTYNPTINDTSPTILRAQASVFPQGIPSSQGTIYPTEFQFGTQVENFDQEGFLAKNSTQQMCINLGGYTIPGGNLTIALEWTEY